MRFAPIETPEGLAALETLRVMGFTLDSTGSAHRLLWPDRSQVNIYRLDGGKVISGLIENVSDMTRGDAAVIAVRIANAALADQAARSKLPQYTDPALDVHLYD